MPGQRAQTATAGVGLQERRQAAGFTVRSFAQRLRISHPTVLRWEAADAVPEAFQEAVEAVLSEIAAETPVTPVREIVKREGEIPIGELQRRLGSGGVTALERELSDGRLMLIESTRTDPLGRRYMETLVVANQRRRSNPPSGSIEGQQVRCGRLALGMTTKQFARRLGIAAPTLRLWETGHRAVPRAWVADVQRALRPSPRDIERLREAAGWTLEEFAREVGVSRSQFDDWEKGRRRIPIDRLSSLQAALESARDAGRPDQRLEVTLAGILEYIALRPGATRAELLHGRLDRSSRTRAISLGLESGRMVERVVMTGDAAGRRRAHPRLFLPADAPAETIDQTMTGDELKTTRMKLRLTRREVAAMVGVALGTVQRWEGLGRGAIPLGWAVEVSHALAAVVPPADRDRSEVLNLVTARPGIPRSSVPVRLHPALDTSTARDEVTQGVSLDSEGRRYAGFYLHGATPAPIESISYEEIAQGRRLAGVTQSELAGAIGVTPNVLSRWETGVRSVPGNRVGAVRQALASVQPRNRTAERIGTIVSAVGAGSRPTDLGPLLSRNGMREAFDKALVEGLIHEEQIFETDSSGRRVRRSWIHSGPAPTEPETTLEMSGTDLLALRRTAGLSQSAVAREFGVSQDAVSRWETRGVPPGRVEALVDLLA